ASTADQVVEGLSAHSHRLRSRNIPPLEGEQTALRMQIGVVRSWRVRNLNGRKVVRRPNVPQVVFLERSVIQRPYDKTVRLFVELESIAYREVGGNLWLATPVKH